MILDLIVIIFVVVLSYLFCMYNDKHTDKNKKNCLLSHIVVGFTVIVFYKLARHYKLKQQLKEYDYTMNAMTSMNPMNAMTPTGTMNAMNAMTPTGTTMNAMTPMGTMNAMRPMGTMNAMTPMGTMNAMTPMGTMKSMTPMSTTMNAMTPEHFTVDSSVSDFISNNTGEIVSVNPNNLDSATLAKYTSKINDLTTQLEILNNNATQPTNFSQTNLNAPIDSISLENQQAYQQLQINFLTKQIKNAQDLINADTISTSTQNYKPIKVFSSCVANADGSLSMDQPIKSEFQSTPTNAVLNSNSTQQIMSTISQNGPNIQSRLQDLLNNLSYS
jgi:hypothetical protein